MEPAARRDRLAAARVARLATVTPGGRPHLVPCCFALVEETAYSAVDAKPKSTLALRRLANLRANPQASLLVDHYAEEWATLWWIRVDGDGRVVDDGAERTTALAALAAKYEQYRRQPPPGAVIALDITAWRAWP
ncbi:MAG TPA: TIGR03668 family PPOX class F420-dependent oxidoreductase [Acidimicrobiales bacterium]|nr:TIGR03668 family PPOX class F420-dependent oxidoreductase [Acidimicrobiales bacterium]